MSVTSHNPTRGEWVLSEPIYYGERDHDNQYNQASPILVLLPAAQSAPSTSSHPPSSSPLLYACMVSRPWPSPRQGLVLQKGDAHTVGYYVSYVQN
jgi:hypothetical protein